MYAIAFWVMAVITNDGVVVFNLGSIYDCIASDNLSRQSTFAQLRPILTPHALKLTPDRLALRHESDSHPAFLSSLTNRQMHACLTCHQGH